MTALGFRHWLCLSKGKCSIEPLVSPQVNGTAKYKGLIISKAISGLHALRGSKFAFVDEKSASGYLYAKALLEEKNIYDTISEMKFLGSHDKVIEAVNSGEVDAGPPMMKLLIAIVKI